MVQNQKLLAPLHSLLHLGPVRFHVPNADGFHGSTERWNSDNVNK